MAQEINKQDDFEESLVRQVIKENPPEEQGFRPEWKEHVGWHRKEYTHLRGAVEVKQQPVATPKNTNRELYIASDKLWFVSRAAVALIVLVIWRTTKTRHKTRRQ